MQLVFWKSRYFMESVQYLFVVKGLSLYRDKIPCGGYGPPFTVTVLLNKNP